MVIDLYDLNVVILPISKDLIVSNEISLLTINMTDRYAVIPKNQAKYIPNINGEIVSEELYPVLLLDEVLSTIDQVEELFSNIDLSTMNISLRNDNTKYHYIYGYVSACKITVDISEENLLYIKLKYPHLMRDTFNEYY